VSAEPQRPNDAPARADEQGLTASYCATDRQLASADTIHCRTYEQHRTFHRLIHGSWVCTICGPLQVDQ
jgi:hypothetical protein